MWIKVACTEMVTGKKKTTCFLGLMCCKVSRQNVWKLTQIHFYLQKKASGRFFATSAEDEQQLRTCNQNNTLKNSQLSVR